MGLTNRAQAYMNRIMGVAERYEDLSPFEIEREMGRISEEIAHDRTVSSSEKTILFKEVNTWR